MAFNIAENQQYDEANKKPVAPEEQFDTFANILGAKKK